MKRVEKTKVRISMDFLIIYVKNYTRTHISARSLIDETSSTDPEVFGFMTLIFELINLIRKFHKKSKIPSMKIFPTV